MAFLARKGGMPLVEWKIDHKTFIGRGWLASLDKGKLKPSATFIPHCTPGCVVAVKVSNNEISGIEIQREILRILDTMSRINNPCCVCLVALDCIGGIEI
jgi:hypothetical protein